MDKAVHNILRVYDQATADEVRQGLEWYSQAHSDCRELHHDVSVAAGVVAALSPGLRWERNIEAARRLIDGESLDGLGVRWFANVRKAERILHNDERPEHVLGGNKVRAFYACISNPQTRLFVCVDGHAYAIQAARRIRLDETPKISDRAYNVISRRYTQAAATASVLPHQMQAITWCVWRRLHGVADGGNGHIAD